jgi:hypothetical protein
MHKRTAHTYSTKRYVRTDKMRLDRFVELTNIISNIKLEDDDIVSSLYAKF